MISDDRNYSLPINAIDGGYALVEAHALPTWSLVVLGAGIIAGFTGSMLSLSL